MRYSKFSVLLASFIVVISIFAFLTMHLNNNEDISLSLFELPENLPYLYCEFNGLQDEKGINDSFVTFIFWQNDKLHRITGTAVNKEEWDFRAYTPGAQQAVNRIKQMHVRKARLIPKPGERNVKGRIIARDAGLISKFMQIPYIPVYFRAELSKQNDDEYIMNFDVLNIESLIPEAWANKLNQINTKDFPFTKTPAYAHFASNITLLELIPQLRNYIMENAKNVDAASSLSELRGTLYATLCSGSALWDGISIPPLLLRFKLMDNTMKHALYDFIYDLFNKKYELTYSNEGYYSYTPSSVWLSQSDNYVETGIIDKRSAAKKGMILPEPPEEALLWCGFSPRYIAEAINSFFVQINPELDFKEEFSRFDQIDSCTFTLNSIKSGVIKWVLKK